MSDEKALQGMILGVSRGHREFAANLATQLSNATEDNANLQAALTTNSDRKAKVDSRISNPAKAHKNEKYGIADKLRTTVKQHLYSIQTHLLKDVAPAIVQLPIHGGALTTAGWALTASTLAAMGAEAGLLITKLGMLKANGWKLVRLSDAYKLLAKAIAFKAEVAIHMKAPAIMQLAEISHRKSELDMEVADVKSVIAQTEMHQVDTFGLDAETLTLIARLAAKFKANGPVTIESNTLVEVISALGVSIKTNAVLQQEAAVHRIIGTGGGSIQIVGPLVSINSLTGVTLPVPVVPVPVVPTRVAITPKSPTEVVPQYEGVNGMGTSIV